MTFAEYNTAINDYVAARAARRASPTRATIAKHAAARRALDVANLAYFTHPSRPGEAHKEHANGT